MFTGKDNINVDILSMLYFIDRFFLLQKKSLLYKRFLTKSVPKDIDIALEVGRVNKTVIY